MNQRIGQVALFTLAFLAGLPLHAAMIGGCVDSPESPTAILGLVSAVGVVAISSRKRLFSLWRAKKK